MCVGFNNRQTRTLGDTTLLHYRNRYQGFTTSPRSTYYSESDGATHRAHSSSCGRFPPVGTVGKHHYRTWMPSVRFLKSMGVAGAWSAMGHLTGCRDARELSNTSASLLRLTVPHYASKRARHGAHARLGSCSWSAHIWPFSLKLGDVPPWSMTVRQLGPRERWHSSRGTPIVHSTRPLLRRRSTRHSSRGETQSSSESWRT